MNFFFYISLTLQIWSLPIVIKSIFVLKNIVSLVVYMFALVATLLANIELKRYIKQIAKIFLIDCV